MQAIRLLARAQRQQLPVKRTPVHVGARAGDVRDDSAHNTDRLPRQLRSVLIIGQVDGLALPLFQQLALLGVELKAASDIIDIPIRFG